MPDKPKPKMTDEQWVTAIQAQRQKRANTGRLTREEDAHYLRQLELLSKKGRQADRMPIPAKGIHPTPKSPKVRGTAGAGTVSKARKVPKYTGPLPEGERGSRYMSTTGAAKRTKAKKVARKGKKKKRGKT